MSMLINDTSFLNRPIYMKGKVRDVYEFGDKLLIIATDRISAFDVVFPNLIPNKGKVLNGMESSSGKLLKSFVPVIHVNLLVYTPEA